MHRSGYATNSPFRSIQGGFDTPGVGLTAEGQVEGEGLLQGPLGLCVPSLAQVDVQAVCMDDI